MTSGTRTNDNTQLISTSIGSGRVGFYETKTWSGTDDPLKKRENVYSMVSSSYSDKVLEWKDAYAPFHWYTGTYRSLIGSLGVVNPVWDANDEINFIIQLKTALAGNSFHLASSVGAEGKDALKQITGSASAIAKAIAHTRKGNFSKALDALGVTPGKRKTHGKQLSGNVLAVQLGMLPLISDAKSAAEALADIVAGPKRTKVKISKAKYGYYHQGYEPNLRCGEIKRIESLIWHSSQSLSISEKLSLTDVPTTLYNAVPLSFVLDWFVPIGNFLEAAMFSAFTLTGYGVRTTFIKGRAYTEDPANMKQHIGWITATRGARYTESKVSVGRSIVDSLPVPYPTLKTLSSVPSWRRALAAVSLIGQRLL